MPVILCVDDDPIQLFLLQFAFERAGFTVLTAHNGQKAVELTAQHQPDIILMDLMMPVKDGYQATLEIKSNPKAAHIPIIIHTAYDQEVVAERARQVGAAEVICKTGSPISLVAKIKELLASYQKEKLEPT